MPVDADQLQIFYMLTANLPDKVALSWVYRESSLLTQDGGSDSGLIGSIEALF